MGLLVCLMFDSWLCTTTHHGPTSASITTYDWKDRNEIAFQDSWSRLEVMNYCLTSRELEIHIAALFIRLKYATGPTYNRRRLRLLGHRAFRKSSGLILLCVIPHMLFHWVECGLDHSSTCIMSIYPVAQCSQVSLTPIYNKRTDKPLPFTAQYNHVEPKNSDVSLKTPFSNALNGLP